MWKKRSFEFKLQFIVWSVFILFLFILSLFGKQMFEKNIFLFSIFLAILFISAVTLGFFYPWGNSEFIGDGDYLKKHGEMLIPSEKRKLTEKKYFNKTKWFILIFINIAFFIPISLWSLGIFENILANLSNGLIFLKFLLIFLFSNLLALGIILKQRIFLFKLLIILAIALAFPAALLFYSSL